MNILDFGEPTAISRLHLTVTFRKHQNQTRKFTTSSEILEILDFWEPTAISRLHLLRTFGKLPKYIQALDFEHFLFNHDGTPQFWIWEGTLFCLNSLLKSVDFELFLVNHDLGSKSWIREGRCFCLNSLLESVHFELFFGKSWLGLQILILGR